MLATHYSILCMEHNSCVHPVYFLVRQHHLSLFCFCITHCSFNNIPLIYLKEKIGLEISKLKLCMSPVSTCYIIQYSCLVRSAAVIIISLIYSNGFQQR